MRRVGVCVSSVSLGAMMVLSAAAVAEEPQPAPPAAVASSAEPPAAEPSATRDDYYTRRAKSVLEAEKTAADKPHPLAARYPGMDVVVCEAGCFDRKGPAVVFLRRHVVAAEGREARMVPTSDTGGTAASRAATVKAPVCVAGCYDDLAGIGGRSEPDPVWYPSAPAAPSPARDALSPIR